MTKPPYDVVVFGATSFVGQILTRYMVEQFGADSDEAGTVSWAAAGRSKAKLEELRDSLGSAGEDLALIIADAATESELRDMCSQTRVVISTVGPYALYGEPLIKVCAETGTDYCDLTGEAQWIKRMLERHEISAIQSGARIVHSCGFDSIPSDLGVFFLQQEAMQRFGQTCPRVKMRVKRMSGGASGGTIASMMNLAKEAAADPALRKELANPYSICPPDHGFSVRQHNVKGAEYDSDFDSWAAPFVMAAINTRIVHRSNALVDPSYDRTFYYDEALLTGAGLKGRMAALGIAGGMGGFMAAAVIPPTRWALEKFVLPKAGEGPSEKAQLRGGYDLRFVGETANGDTLQVKVTGDRDPGYGSTAKMLGQAAVCLALDITKKDKPGGFWTPATVFGDHLIERLRAHSGLTFELTEG
ncbi:MAG: saccharopine dehydrogenase family protein [Pseudomonadales bacterium]